MSTLRISDAPLLPDVDGTEKIPTGGRGDYTISVDQIKDHIFQDVGKELVGLGNVDNTSDLDKPVSTAQQAALDLKADKTYVDTNLNLKADKTNVYTRSETSLALSKKADLVNGVVPENQIPSSFNDVLEFTTPNLPIVGESGKIYVTTDTNKTWRWATNKYVEISGWNPDSVSKRVTIPTYNNATDGVNPVTGVANGAYFNVRSTEDDGFLVEYQNIGGVPTPSGKSYPSSSALNNIPHNNLKDRDMAEAHPASAIEDASGKNQQEINEAQKLINADFQEFYDAYQLKAFAFVTPEMFGDTAVDASDAINAAFATGKRVEFDPDKTYPVSKEIITKGQELGFVKFNSSRKHQDKVAYGFVENKVPIKKEDIKFTYVQISYDLIEFLKIKSLGFNTIVHYFQNADTTKFPIILDNAKAAGLDVVVVTEQIGTGNIVTPAVATAFIQTIDSHPAVVGYYLFDEPVGRNISFATQNAMIDAVKAVTTKPLWVGENYFKTSHVLLPSAQLPTRYDIYSIHQYALRQDSGIALATRINNDLNTARKYFSVFKSIYGELLGKTVIPTVGLFSPPSDADQYTKDKAQVVGLADRYSFASEGHRGCFIWDALLENIAVTPEYQAQAIKLNSAYRTKNRNPNNYAVVFGSVDGGYNFGINQVSQMGSVVRNTDAEIGRLHAVANAGNAGMYGVFSPSAGNYSGILYRNANTSFLSHFKVARYLTVSLAITDLDGLTAGLLTTLYITRDKGITKAPLYSSGLTNIQGTFEQGGGAGELIIEVQTTAASPNYRRLVSGVIMSTDW